MSKIKYTSLHKLVKDFPSENIVTDGTILRCNACDSKLTIDKKHQRLVIERHVATQKHKKNTDLQRPRPRQSFIGESLGAQADKNKQQNEFFADTAAAFLQSGIPLQKINEPAFKKYLEKYMKRSVPDESTVRKNYMEPVYDATMKRVIEEIGDSPVYFVIDETTDELNRYVLNILIAPLNGKPTKSMLFKTYFLERTNHQTVMQSFNDACAKLWPSGIQYDKVLLVLSDQASYMKLAFSSLKFMYPSLKHVTCLVHCLHIVAECVREQNPVVNKFISDFKKILLKCPARVQLYKEVTDLPLPPTAVLTRWGTWISCAVFYAENFNKISEFLERLSSADSQAIAGAKALVNSPETKDQLFTVHAFSFLVESMQKLEKEGLAMQEQWDIFTTTKSKLFGIYLEKCEKSLEKNPDIMNVVATSDLEFRIATKYAPLVSVDVERSFSTYKYLLGDRQHNFTTTNIAMINAINFNSFLFDRVTDISNDNDD